MYTPVDVCIERIVDQIENAVYSDYERTPRNGDRNTRIKGRNIHDNGDRGTPTGTTPNPDSTMLNGRDSLIFLRSMVVLSVVTISA